MELSRPERTAVDDTLRLSRRLDAALSSGSRVAAHEALEGLGSLTMTLGVLQETKVGRTITQVARNPDASIAALATTLLTQWKALARAAGAVEATRSTSTGSSATAGSSGSAVKVREPQAAPAKTAPPGGAASKAAAGAAAAPAASPSGLRTKALDMLVAELVKVGRAVPTLLETFDPDAHADVTEDGSGAAASEGSGGGSGSSSGGSGDAGFNTAVAVAAMQEVATKFVAALDTAMRERYTLAARPDAEYAAHFKDMMVVLPTNSPLVVAILSGRLPPSKLAFMTAVDMQSDETKKELDEIRRKQYVACTRRSWSLTLAAAAV